MGPETSVTSAPRRAATARDRVAHLPGRGVRDEPDRVDRLARRPGGDEHAPAGEVEVPEQARGRERDLLRRREPPLPDVAVRELARGGADDVEAARAQRRDVLLGRRVPPHPGVHRGGDEDRTGRRERRRRHRVVGHPGPEAGEEIGGRRRHDEQVGGAREREVAVGRLRGGIEQVHQHGRAGERLERERLDEARGGRRHRDADRASALHDEPRELARLVGGDPAADPEDDRPVLEVHGAGY